MNLSNTRSLNLMKCNLLELSQFGMLKSIHFVTVIFQLTHYVLLVKRSRTN